MMILSLNMKKAYKHFIIPKRILFWHWKRKNKQLGEGRFWGVSEELLPFGMKDPTASQHCPTAGTCLLVGRAIGLQDHRAGPCAGSAAGAYVGSSHNTSLSTTTSLQGKQEKSHCIGAVVFSAPRSRLLWRPPQLLKSEECCLLALVLLLPYASSYPGVKVRFPI